MIARSFSLPALLACLSSAVLPALPQTANAYPNKPAETRQRQTYVAPFIPWAHHGGPIVTVWLNDKTAVRLLLDTGASACFLREKVARDMGLEPKDLEVQGAPISFGGLETSKAVTVAKTEIGPLRINKLTFVVLHSLDNSLSGEDQIDGMIGLPVLSKFAVFLDYSRHTAAFIYPGDLSKAEVEGLGFGAPSSGHAPLMQKIRALHFPGVNTVVQDNLYSTHITLHNGDKKTESDIWVDTGSPTTNIERKVALRVGLSAGKTTPAWTYATGERLLNTTHVAHMEVGTLPVADMPLFYPTTSSDDDEFPALLGADILSFCNVLFDYPGKTLYLRPVLEPMAAPPASEVIASTPAPDHSRLAALAQCPWIGFSINLPFGALPESEEEHRLTVEAAEAAVASASAEEKPRKLDALGHAYLRLGNTKRAQETFLAAATAWQSAGDPYRPEFIRDLALTPTGTARAVEEARTLTERSPQKPEPWTTLGECLARHASFLLTGSPVPHARSSEPSSSSELEDEETGEVRNDSPIPDERLRAAEDDVDEALTCYSRAISLSPKDPALYRERAAFRVFAALNVEIPALRQRGKHVDTNERIYTYSLRDDIQKASDLAPENVADLFQSINLEILATAHQDSRDIGYRDEPFWSLLPNRTRRVAEQRMERLEVLRKNPAPALAARAAEALGILRSKWLDDDERATALFQEALAKDPKRSLPALRYLSAIMSHDQKYDVLIPILAAHLTDQDNADTHLLLARTLERAGKTDQALAEAGEVVRRRPESVDANLFLAVLLLRRFAVDNNSDAQRRVAVCLDTVETKQKTARQREVYNDTRAVYFALADQTGPAETYALRSLKANRADTEAREILAVLHPTPAAEQTAEAK